MSPSVLYELVLFSHSWLRWLILALTLFLIIRAVLVSGAGRPLSTSDDRLFTALVGMVDLQMLLGLSLYFGLSPLVKAALSDFSSAMREPALRFVAVEHVVAMFLAVVILHVGRVRTRRADEAVRARHARRWLIGFAVFALAGIPWPFLPYGRPLLRLTFADLG